MGSFFSKKKKEKRKESYLKNEGEEQTAQRYFPSRLDSNGQPHSHDHMLILGKSLNMLRKNQTLCDVTLLVNDPSGKGVSKYPAHKCVLVGSSGYFRDTLGLSNMNFVETIQVKQSSESTIKKQDPNIGTIQLDISVGPDIMEAVLNFLYLGTAKVTWDNLAGVIKAAHYLQIPALVHTCINFSLHNKFEPEKFKELYDLSSSFNSLDLQHDLLEKTVLNFDEMHNSHCFSSLTYEQLQRVLDHRVMVPKYVNGEIPELQFYEGILKWFQQVKDWFEEGEHSKNLQLFLAFKKTSCW